MPKRRYQKGYLAFQYARFLSFLHPKVPVPVCTASLWSPNKTATFSTSSLPARPDLPSSKARKVHDLCPFFGNGHAGSHDIDCAGIKPGMRESADILKLDLDALFSAIAFISRCQIPLFGPFDVFKGRKSALVPTCMSLQRRVPTMNRPITMTDK